MPYLTKSKFKLALDCPGKLHYYQNGYPSTKADNSFLESLANGGFQVGELAKCYHPFGIEVREKNAVSAAVKTARLMQRPRVTLFEAAFLYNNLLVRVDVLRKNGNVIELLEVKSKTFDPTDAANFTQKNTLPSEWKEYVYDVAFQKHVVQLCHPEAQVAAHLYLIDKSAVATVDGLNQLFIVSRTKSGGAKVARSRRRLTGKELGAPVLCKVNVDRQVQDILDGNDKWTGAPLAQVIEGFNAPFRAGTRPEVRIGSKCGTCEYRTADPAQNGFRECWKACAGFGDEDFAKPSTLDLWALYMGTRKDLLIQDGKYFLSDISRADIEPRAGKETGAGMSHIDRRMVQIEKAVSNDPLPALDAEGLRAQVKSWVYPLHFIDFETTAVALPFYAGTRPYEQIAFQFSHHTLQKNGKVEHKTEWINREPGKFPNFEFVRRLKAALGTKGTIFRFATHENSILNAIYRQLLDSDEPDAEALCDWIQTVTVSVRDAEEVWAGKRSMVDLCELVKKYYYHPASKGSNSIKAVMGAVLSTSTRLREKYGQPSYGAAHKSRNFTDMCWVQEKDGVVQNPYALLPALLTEHDPSITYYSDSFELKDGGAAMTAYAKAQYVHMHPSERDAIFSALLKYCELDTLSMVMLVEEWLHELAHPTYSLVPVRAAYAQA